MIDDLSDFGPKNSKILVLGRYDVIMLRNNKFPTISALLLTDTPLLINWSH